MLCRIFALRWKHLQFKINIVNQIYYSPSSEKHHYLTIINFNFQSRPIKKVQQHNKHNYYKTSSNSTNQLQNLHLHNKSTVYIVYQTTETFWIFKEEITWNLSLSTLCMWSTIITSRFRSKLAAHWKTQKQVVYFFWVSDTWGSTFKFKAFKGLYFAAIVPLNY